jgi:hypothetical protein
METTEAKIPNYVFEDLLFRRRLQRNINDELGRLNRLLEEQVELLQKRKELMAEVHESVHQRWKDEEAAEPDIHSQPETDGDRDAH